mmetsp:Transcript_51673/g.83387  ORF Transcript_51673/g.83387 Transcript_51673/m.83387 type:complete len:258 (+) Transcript_51673:724-1497(+)
MECACLIWSSASLAADFALASVSCAVFCARSFSLSSAFFSAARSSSSFFLSLSELAPAFCSCCSCDSRSEAFARAASSSSWMDLVLRLESSSRDMLSMSCFFRSFSSSAIFASSASTLAFLTRLAISDSASFMAFAEAAASSFLRRSISSCSLSSSFMRSLSISLYLALLSVTWSAISFLCFFLISSTCEPPCASIFLTAALNSSTRFLNSPLTLSSVAAALPTLSSHSDLSPVSRVLTLLLYSSNAASASFFSRSC